MVPLKGFEDKLFSILMNGKNGSNHHKTLNKFTAKDYVPFHFSHYTLVGHLSGIGIN